jgi:transposase
MFIDFTKMRIYIRPGHTDMRKQASGLSLLVSEEMLLDVFSRHLFFFCNKRRNLLKAVYWDRNGFCLWQKKLEKEKFPWPEEEKNVRELTQQQLSWLLEGIDFFHPHKRLNYSRLS